MEKIYAQNILYINGMQAGAPEGASRIQVMFLKSFTKKLKKILQFHSFFTFVDAGNYWRYCMKKQFGRTLMKEWIFLFDTQI